MTVTAKIRHPEINQQRQSFADVGSAYSAAGDNYLTYADGDPTRLFSFNSQHAYSDRTIWALLERKMIEQRATGAQTMTILDAGCGPGTWLRRMVTRARELGFSTIKARGIDMAQAQVAQARYLSRDLADAPGVTLRFEVGDLLRPVDAPDAAFDLTLCLYCVLNHLPARTQPDFLAEMARVTAGQFVATVRSVGSPPTIYMDAIENARGFRQDNDRDLCHVELTNGRQVTLNSHLFTAKELRSLAGRHFDVAELRGLDLFHSRFAPDRRWSAGRPDDSAAQGELEQLERLYATDPRFIDRATHLLLAGGRKRSAWSTWMNITIRSGRP